MRLLARKYRNPIKNGICNYLDFHQDIIRLQNELNAAKNAQKEVTFDDEADFGSKVANIFQPLGSTALFFLLFLENISF